MVFIIKIFREKNYFLRLVENFCFIMRKGRGWFIGYLVLVLFRFRVMVILRVLDVIEYFYGVLKYREFLYNIWVFGFF